MSPSEHKQASANEQWGCQTEDLLMIHAIFRKAFGHAENMVKKTSPEDSARVQLVTAHIKEAMQALHNHHHHEDTLFWEPIKERAPEARADIDRLDQQHKEVARKIEDTIPLLDAWSKEPAKSDALLNSLAELKSLLFHHLDDEEQHMMPVAARVLTQMEWEAPRSLGMKEIPRDRLLYQLGYMLRCAPTEELRNTFWQALPLPPKVLYKLFGRKKFEQEWERLYG